MNPDAASEAAVVVSEIILEVDPATGAVLKSFDLWDLLDQSRIGYKGIEAPSRTEAGPSDQRDWTHANALHYVPGDDSFLVSVCHQDCIINILK